VYKRNAIGDHDEIVVCTFDLAGAPVATDGSSARLEWSIKGVGAPPSVRFNPSPPPEETTGPGARAIVGIDALQDGDNHIDVSLIGPSGDIIDASSLEKQVYSCICPPRNVPTRLTARNDGRFIRGHATATEEACESSRDVSLYRRREGEDDNVGSDQTNASGAWRVKVGRRRGIFYARVTSAALSIQGNTVYCLADQSKDVRRPGRS
jgi:hypothetical protein